MIQQTQLSMVRGDTLEFQVVFEGLPGAIDAMAFTCRQYPGATSIVFQKTIGSGITAEQDGSYTVRVAPADTATIQPSMYAFDLQVTIGTDIYTPLIGSLEVVMDITY